MMPTRIRSIGTASLLFWMALGLVACGGSDGGGSSDNSGPPTLKNQTLQGKMKGQSWTLTAGKATVSNDRIRINLFDGPGDACNFNERQYTGWQIVTNNVPAEETRRSLTTAMSGDGQRLNFTNPPTNIPIGQGFVEVTSITESSIQGNIVAYRNDQTFVNGRFEAARCDNQ